MNAVDGGQLDDTVFSFTTRDPRFFGIGIDRFAPISLAKQMEHQIPLDFGHAISRTLEEYRFTRHFASFAATVNRPLTWHVERYLGRLEKRRGVCGRKSADDPVAVEAIS